MKSVCGNGKWLPHTHCTKCHTHSPNCTGCCLQTSEQKELFHKIRQIRRQCLGLGLHDSMMAVASEQVGLGGEQTNKAALTPLPSPLIPMAHCRQRALVTHKLQTSNHMEYSSKCILTSKSSPGNGNSSNIIYYYGHSMTTTLNVSHRLLPYATQ